MTASAIIAKCTFMHIVLCMTGAAVRWCDAIYGVGRVAICAGGRYVTTPQREIGKRVVENAGIQVHDIGVPALVIRVATYTLAVLGCRKQTVKAAADLAVIADVLVT
jgi:hypothetical protein